MQQTDQNLSRTYVFLSIMWPIFFFGLSIIISIKYSLIAGVILLLISSYFIGAFIIATGDHFMTTIIKLYYGNDEEQIEE
ncbi:MAG: hypothetical protein ACD_79C00246G0001 [uncultured bacterium]|nr:MAG: hypothetical protein ACD_79C00246G0001 [uncultured bacterium]